MPLFSLLGARKLLKHLNKYKSMDVLSFVMKKVMLSPVSLEQQI